MELKVIVMRGECGADSPFWSEAGRFIEVDALPLSPGLRDTAKRWAIGLDNARANDASEEEEEKWRRAGARLHAQVASALGSGFIVLYDMQLVTGRRYADWYVPILPGAEIGRGPSN